jgi:hypothetical protein
LESNLRIALLVAFGDDTSSTSRQQIARCRTKDQLATFCLSQPDKSLIFVLDQFNAVQEDSTYSYRGSKQEIVRDFLIKVRAFVDFFDLLVYFMQLSRNRIRSPANTSQFSGTRPTTTPLSGWLQSSEMSLISSFSVA